MRSVPQETLSSLECLFLKDSQRRIRRIRWARRAIVVIAVMIAIVGFLYRAETQARQAKLETQLAQEQTRSARQVTEATVTQAELEQGRSALLHDEPDAQLHLSRAYQRGDHSPSTAFMLARALQPRMAEQARLASTAGRMWSAAFSPDGRQIVTTDDRAAQVWDARTYRRTFVLFHGDTVYQALYSADGARIVTAGGDGTIKIWDAASGALVRELRKGGARLRYFIAALSPDGRLAATIDKRGDIAHVWDATTGAPVAEIRWWISSVTRSSPSSRATSVECSRHAGWRVARSSLRAPTAPPGCGTGRRAGSARSTEEARGSSPTRRSRPTAW